MCNILHHYSRFRAMHPYVSFGQSILIHCYVSLSLSLFISLSLSLTQTHTHTHTHTLSLSLSLSPLSVTLLFYTLEFSTVIFLCLHLQLSFGNWEFVSQYRGSSNFRSLRRVLLIKTDTLFKTCLFLNL